jgi:hypothetical protein
LAECRSFEPEEDSAALFGTIGNASAARTKEQIMT